MPTRADKAISHGKGMFKAVGARLKGLGGVFTTLCEQHGQAGALLERVANDPMKRGDLWPKIRAELVSHERGELLVVYPELRLHAATRMFAEDHEREAAELEATIERLDVSPLASEEWGEIFDELIGLVKHHVAEEESKIFPAAQKAIGDKRARELDVQFRAAKQREMAAH